MIKNQQNWFALEITIDSEAMEAVEFALNELNSLGTEINNLGKKQSETVCVIGYFNEKPAAEIVKTQIDEALRIYGFQSSAVKEILWREVENTDWLEEWKKHWKPTKTGKFVVAPTWSEVGNEHQTSIDSPTREIVIRIDPEMAFGTGTHETTRLCLLAIEENYTSEMSFFDVGTGTGILAIAAAKLKSEVRNPKPEIPSNNISSIHNSISACDTDENSVEIARKNAELNQVAGEINFYGGSINHQTPAFDFVCANLTADVILPLLPLLVEKARQNLVLSGILKTQETSVAEKLRELKVANFRVQNDGEWISILIEKGNSG